VADKKGAKDEPDETDVDEESSDGEESPDSDANAKVERNASTAGVAKALGVDDDEEEGEEEKAAVQPAAPPNRAARRRDEVLKKRRAARGTDEQPVKTAGDDEEAEGEEEEEAPVVAARDPLPKDKNARAKELLRRRKEAAEGKSANIGLSAGEVVQDQLARAGGAAGRWFQRHFRKIIVGSVLGVVAVVGTIQYLSYREQEAGKASDALMKGVANETGAVFNDDIKDGRAEQLKAYDPRPVFTSFGARTDAALASKDASSGVGVLAKLSEAGALLDKAQYQQAENAFVEVLKTDLAKADIDVKARALEGKAMALEGKKDFEGAATAFKELEAVDKSFEDLSKYHQARMHLRKGEKDQAKEILVALDKKLDIPTADGVKQVYLRSAVGDYLRQIDPALARRPNFGGTRGTVTPEQMEMYKKQLEQMQQQQQQKEPHGEHGEGEGPPQLPVPGAEHGDDGTR
jgi:hypothetical protein